MLQHTVGTQNEVAVEPVAHGLLGLVVGNGGGCTACIQGGAQILAGGVIVQDHQVVGAGLIGIGDVDRHAADGDVFDSLIGDQIGEVTGQRRCAGAVEHVEEIIALAIGEVVALGNGVLVAAGIDHVVVGCIGGVDLAVNHCCAGVVGIGVS